MSLAPPPERGPRIHDLGHSLVVSFLPARRGIVFMTVFLVIWTCVGLGLLQDVVAGSMRSAFVLFWLVGWAVGEATVLVDTAWLLGGRATLTVSADRLELRKAIGRFSKTKSYDGSRVTKIAPARVPTDDDERAREDFCLRIDYDDETLYLGEGMNEREAEYVAELATARLAPPLYIPTRPDRASAAQFHEFLENS